MLEDAGALVPAVLLQCLIGLPLFIVLLAAGFLIAQRAQNNRNAAFMALGGIALAAVNLAGGVFSSMAAPLLIRQGTTATNTGVVLSAIGVILALVGTASWGLVLAALVMALGKPGEADGPVGND